MFRNISLLFKLLTLSIIFLANFFIFQDHVKAAPPIEPTDLAIWHFDENTAAIAHDATDNNNNLTWFHNYWGGGRYFPERVEGKWDLGINFNHYPEGYSKNFSPMIEFPQGLTVGAWIKTDLTLSYNSRFFWLGNTRVSGVLKNHFMLSVKDSRVTLNLKKNYVWQPGLVSNIIVNDNEWHFVAARFNAIDQVMSLFVDGEKQSQSNFELPIPKLEVTVVGAKEDKGAAYNRNFKGSVDDVWIKSDSLTDTQIFEIYQSDAPYKADIELPDLAEVQTQSYYNFNEDSGKIAYDLSGNSYDLNWSYNHWSSDAPTPRWVNGKFDNAVKFKKTEDLFRRNFSPEIYFPDGLVLGVWVKTSASSSPNDASIVWMANRFFDNGNPRNYFVIAEHQGRVLVRLKYRDGCDGTVYGPECHYRIYRIISDKFINDNNWHFLTVVLDSRPYHHSIKFYIDGELEGEEHFPSPVLFLERLAVGFRVNRFCGQQCNFDGDIDDLFILSSVISGDEVRQIYKSNQAFIWPLGPDPVIIVPGIMGSWEKNGYWHIDPILHTYDNLIEAMVNNGYELNETLFTFPYDWRVSNVLTADLLKQKITEVKQQTNTSKVDIVAHSMGGLVSRYYVQSNEYNNDVDQLIFLGTPHQGSPESYLAYEGAYLTGGFYKLKKYIFQIEAIKHGYLSLAKYIREQIISTEQLLPVFNYLQDKLNNQWVMRTYPVQYPRNTFLENLNVSPGIETLKQRVDITNVYSSAGTDSTLNLIRVIPDSDIYDNKWMHGYPENLDNNPDCLIYSDGDGTVPSESLDFLQNVSIIEMADTDHREIVNKAQKEVIEILTGVRPDAYQSGPWSTIKRILFIRVYSPVDFVVVAPDSKMIGKDFTSSSEINQIDGAFYSGYNSDIEFVTILNPLEGDYQVILQGTDNGIYQIGVDILEENDFAEPAENLISGIITTGEEEGIVFNYAEDDAEIEIIKEINFNDLIKDLNELYLDGQVNKESVKQVLDIEFNHLKEKYDKIEDKEKELHQEILKKQITHFLEIIRERLSHYLEKQWLTHIAYDILSIDIVNIINQLN